MSAGDATVMRVYIVEGIVARVWGWVVWHSRTEGTRMVHNASMRHRGFAQQEDRTRVCLLGGFEVECGSDRIRFPAVGSRLIAFLALQQRPIARATVAGTLWPETTQGRAQASLRSTLWRIRKVHDQIFRSAHDCLWLAEEVDVDVHALLEAARCVETGLLSDDSGRFPISWFSHELLPDWYEDWVVFERERFRLMALHALEGMAASHSEQGRHRDAVECSLAAVRLEPLRESSHRALISAHVRQGNLAEAVHQYHRYRELLLSELGLDPSHHMTEILASVGLSDWAR